MSESAKKPDVDINQLRVLRARSEQLNAQIVEAQLQGAQTANVQAECHDLLSQLDQRLQVHSVRQMQSIADADARRAVDEAKAILQEVEANTHSRQLQWRGEKLAEAELHLNRIDKLCSIAIQNEARQVLEAIRRQAIAFRTQQAREYNLWAIGNLEQSIADFKRAKGWFNDNEEEFMKTLREKVGRIDPQHLHPVTYSLFAEMFQKFLSELNPDQKVKVTRAVETTERKPLSDF